MLRRTGVSLKKGRNPAAGALLWNAVRRVVRPQTTHDEAGGAGAAASPPAPLSRKLVSGCAGVGSRGAGRRTRRRPRSRAAKNHINTDRVHAGRCPSLVSAGSTSWGSLVRAQHRPLVNARSWRALRVFSAVAAAFEEPRGKATASLLRRCAAPSDAHVCSANWVVSQTSRSPLQRIIRAGVEAASGASTLSRELARRVASGA
jgi:hypothetical protein